MLLPPCQNSEKILTKKYSGFLLKNPCPIEVHSCSDFRGWKVLRKTFPDAWMMFCGAEGAVCAAFPQSCRCRCYRREMCWNINKIGTAGWRIGTKSGGWKVLHVRVLNLSSLRVWFKFVCIFFSPELDTVGELLVLKNKTKHSPRNLKRETIDLNVQFCLTASCQNLSIKPPVLETILT